jgi:acetyl/propionyl-CoA carboxylase alpha subunit
MRREGTPSAADTAGAITAAMPGLVVKVLKKQRKRSPASGMALILEAMKMQSQLRASQSGVVKQINIREGESISTWKGAHAWKNSERICLHGQRH